MIKKLSLAIILFSTSLLMAQKSLNNYKYVIVPNKFEFLKKADQYQTSSLTKFLFEEKKYHVFLSNEKLPLDLTTNYCSSLNVKIRKKSDFFGTKLKIELNDCFNNIVYKSKVGKSKLINPKRAYYEAIKDAFKNIPMHKYNAPTNTQTPPNKNVKTIVPTTPVETPSVKNNTILYAQATTNGYQLVNTKPEVVFQIVKTNLKDVYIIKDTNGILYKNGDIWISEILNKETKQYQIKF